MPSLASMRVRSQRRGSGRDVARRGGGFEYLQGTVEATLGALRDVVPVVATAIAAPVGPRDREPRAAAVDALAVALERDLVGCRGDELAPDVVHRVVGETYARRIPERWPPGALGVGDQRHVELVRE